MEEFTESQLKIIQAVIDYINCREEDPFGAGELYGCDCGCGGDSITEEDIEAYDDAMEEVRGKLKTAFEKHNIN